MDIEKLDNRTKKRWILEVGVMQRLVEEHSGDVYSRLKED